MNQEDQFGKYVSLILDELEKSVRMCNGLMDELLLLLLLLGAGGIQRDLIINAAISTSSALNVSGATTFNGDNGGRMM